jgi:hypothetical protein
MNNLLYTYEEVCERIEEKELTQFERDDARDKFLWQFAKNGSSLHVHTVMQSRYVLYATEKDFNYIKRKAEAAMLDLVLKESKKEMLEAVIAQYEEVTSKAILFIRQGNRVLQEKNAERNLPHVIIFFTNENLDFVLDCVKENAIKKEKEKAVEVKRVMPVYKPAAPKLPELTDEEIKNAIPEGSVVSHTKYGTGTVKAVLGGKIKVLFENSVEKIFAAQVCIDKKLLTVL